MTIDLTPYLPTHGPKYLAIARALAEAIRQGDLTPGTRLPPHRCLAETLAVSVQTVSRAYAQAEKMGLVQARVGSGTWINTLDDGQETDYLRGANMAMDVSPVDLSIAHPICPPGHHLRFRETLRDMADNAHPDVIDACRPIAGLLHQRERASQWLHDTLGVPGTPDDRVLCNGAAHGVMLAIATLVQHGDVVLTEALSDHGLIALSRTLGLQLRGVAIDEQGVMPDALDAACRRYRPRVVCLTPTQLNPTGATMDNARRDAVAEVLARHGTWLIEDDVHALLEPPGLTPLTARLPRQSFHVTSLTKATVSGLRAGYLSVPRGQLHHTLPRLRATSWMATPLVFEIADRWLADGTVDALASEQRRLLAERQQLTRTHLAGHTMASRPTGMHIWLALPGAWRAEELQQQALQEGLAISTAQSFMVDQGPPPRRIRVSLGGENDPERFAQGLTILARLLGEAPPPMLQII
ncbi:GntR family transcriptional regulator [Chromohalobacter marismortui]|uniref:GntR family transcriptional regulator n=1 Tax=Chromohalobacter marismortui TaxID=42055 RepID=A0A4R7NLI6_9GAMM|nr:MULTISPECIES: PLP-dependent aminotransferase family protein [Chromohalobacter]MCI0510216.1 PLP-dependent aminotransferase family protein [Chromohalobacter sp.]MCI0593392.1 PLP-dependent aminotransferase family protein [Chromohalobacter sp.]TDU21634.1 GntR family transcriptional regulator [Chromohalobacter marismortui]